MNLYLIRHGIAHDLHESGIAEDSQRQLTKEGKEQLKEVSKGLVKLKIRPCHIFSSPLIRARQTAEIIANTFNHHQNINIIQSLAPGYSFSDLYKDLKAHSPFEEIFLVGHEPSLSLLASHLLWANDKLNISFKKASVCRIDIYDIPPTTPGTLKWILTPKLIQSLIGL